jgi:gliding motility-associated lipoprotein GldB
MNRTQGFLLVVLFILAGCTEDRRIAAEIEEIPVRLKIGRFDQAFANAGPSDLRELKSQYPYLFPPQYSDSVWLAKMDDSIQRELQAEVQKAFPDFDDIRDQLQLFYKHVLYYVPREEVPMVVTVTSDVDYRNRIILTDSLLLIGLDNYLGTDHRFYRGIDRYIASDLDRQYLISDVAGAFAKKVNPLPRERSFLAQMLYYGRELYLKDRLLPLLTDEQKIGYSDEELQWARENEEQIWRYFIERELLYSTDAELGPRFLEPAPFSKFRLELDNESPGRLGRYLGWQIVRTFMSAEEISLGQMLHLPAEELFRRSNYKPKK